MFENGASSHRHFQRSQEERPFSATAEMRMLGQQREKREWAGEQGGWRHCPFDKNGESKETIMPQRLYQ